MFGSKCYTSNSSRHPVSSRRYSVSTSRTCGIPAPPIDANSWVRGTLAFDHLELLRRIILIVRSSLPRYKVFAAHESVSTRSIAGWHR
jgi:hypothetical protein